MFKPSPSLPGTQAHTLIFFCQKVWASSFLPNEPPKSTVIVHFEYPMFFQSERQLAYFKKNGRTLLLDYLQLELDKKVC